MTQAERARKLVKQHGQNPTSYLVLEDDKHLYFGKATPGVIAYGIVGKTIVVCGDPVCAPDDFVNLLEEFKLFCVDSSCQCAFLGTTDAFLEQYTALGYSHIPYGEEARFHLASYQLTGRKMMRIRNQVNHAVKAGLTTHEYRPHENRDPAIEAEFHAISEQWLQSKKSSELKFTVGSVCLEHPMDRRYFYARDTSGHILAFHVFIPFADGNGYTAAITRRHTDAPRGVTEKLNYDAFMTFKEEDVAWGSLGLAPLANVCKEGEKHNTNVKLLNFVYEKCNCFYGFKALHQAKRKYNPTTWRSGHFVYSTKNITPQMAYAIVKIQNPSGIRDYFRGFLADWQKSGITP